MLHYNIWKGYRPRLEEVACPMSQYDLQAFRPRPVWDEESHKWIDANLAARKQNNRPIIEQEIARRREAGHGGPQDIAIQPFPVPQSSPEKFASPADFERAQQTFQAVQGAYQSSGGMQSTEAALRVGPINQ